MDIGANIQLTPGDLEQVSRQLIKIKRTYVWSVLFLAVGIMSIAEGKGVIWTVFFFADAVLFPVVVWRSRRTMVNRNLHAIAGPWTVRITDEWFELHTEVSRVRTQWATVSTVQSVAKFWLLRYQNRVVSFIPKAAFNPADQMIVEEFFVRRFSARRKLLRFRVKPQSASRTS